MGRSILAAAALTAVIAGSGAALGAESVTKAEAIAMVDKAVASVKSAGADATFSKITAKSEEFIDRDLYIVVYRIDGAVLAHGANDKLVGKNLIDAEDVDGRPYVKERVELAKSKGKFWQDYKFVNPVSKKIEPKEMYCELTGENIVCGGIYKK